MPGATLTFLGGAQTVTGSKYLLQHGRARILLDCGLFQGFKHLRERNWAEPPFNPAQLDAVILSHAHLDHSGWIPALVKRGFRGRVWCSAASRDLCGILLPDSGWLQEEEARYAEKHGFSKHSPPRPLYTKEEAERSLKYLHPVPFDAEFAPAEGLRAKLLPAGHLPGAALVRVEWEGGSLLFSGDLGRDDDPLLRPPVARPEAGALLLESTYGDRLHEDAHPEKTLGEVIRRTARRGGITLIPAFAVGRAQVLLHLLWRLKRRRAIPNLPVYLNSPMAIAATRMLLNHPGSLRVPPAECEQAWEAAIAVETVEESKALNKLATPAIIIAASGMATGGRVLHHLKAFGPGAKHTILLAGFQAGGTRGADLAAGARTLKIHGAAIPINAEVVQLHTLSAHADAAGLTAWARAGERPEQLWLVHGEPAAAEALRKRIAGETGWSPRVAEAGATIEL